MKRRSARIKESASRDRCPPLSSDRDCFQTPPNATRTSRPSKKVPPSGGASFAVVPGSKVENIEPKSLKKMMFSYEKQCRWSQRGNISSEELTNSLINFNPSNFQRLLFLLIKFFNHFLNFSFIILHKGQQI